MSDIEVVGQIGITLLKKGKMVGAVVRSTTLGDAHMLVALFTLAREIEPRLPIGSAAHQIIARLLNDVPHPDLHDDLSIQ